MTVALTQTDLDRLEAALATGELTVDYGEGRRVTYRSIAELRQAIDYTKAQLQAASADGATTSSVTSFTRD